MGFLQLPIRVLRLCLRPVDDSGSLLGRVAALEQEVGEMAAGLSADDLVDGGAETLLPDA